MALLGSPRLAALFLPFIWILLLFIKTSQGQQLSFNTVTPVTWTTTPFSGRSIPLAVKGPCNSVWSSQSTHTSPINQNWARTWDSFHDVKGWYALVRVDGTPYMLLGDATTPNITIANQTSVVITPTRTSYLLEAGPVVVNMTFLSPIEPSDPVKMSSPFSYLYFTFSSTDPNASHVIQIYSDITGEWISSNNQFNMTWAGATDGSLTTVHATLSTPQPFQTIGGTCQDGTVYYAMKSSNKSSWQIDLSSGMRSAYASSGALNNSAAQGFRTIVDGGFTAFGVAVDVGVVSGTSDPVVYAIGLVRDPVIQYIDPAGQLQLLSPLYHISYGSVSDLLQAVFDNFTDSITAAQSLDLKIAGDGDVISSAYAGLLAVSTRQAFGAADLTTGSTAVPGTRAFAWDIGAVGSGGISAVDVIYAALPAYVYLWPDLLGLLLAPLFEYQNSSRYTNVYAAQDLGTAYPNATGDSLPHNTQIEQSANMLVMALAHAQASGDGSLLGQYYDLLISWANFLVNNTLAPSSTETTSISDSIFGANQTNLALKGIIGIGAMAKISGYGKKKDDQSHYQDIAEQYAQQWTSLATTTDSVSLNYGSSESGVIYNLFADKLLQTSLINDSVFELQTAYYKSQIPHFQYGLPLSSSNTGLARSDWTMFAAAVATDTFVRESLISGIQAYASSSTGSGDWPFAVLYDPGSADELTNSASNASSNDGGINSFAQGAMFAPLALNVSIKSVSFTPNSISSVSHRKTNAGAITGGVVGGIGALIIGALAIINYLRRRRCLSTGMLSREIRVEPWTLTTKEVAESSLSGFSPIERRNVPVMHSFPVFREKGALPALPVPLGLPSPSPHSNNSHPAPLSSTNLRALERAAERRLPFTKTELSGSSGSGSGSGWTESRYTYTGTGDYLTESGCYTPTDTVPLTSRRGTRLYDPGRRHTTRHRNTATNANVLASLAELEALRREVERIRIAQEQNSSGGQSSSEFLPPPSYHDEMLDAARAGARPPSSSR